MAQRRTKRPDAIQRDEHWYRLPLGAPVHTSVVPYGQLLLQNESSFHAKNLARERIYRGVDLQNQKSALAALERGGLGIARLNALKAICDTFSSRLSKDRPMPSFVTDDSDWALKRQAKKFREFIVGQMLETEFDDLSRRALHDGTRLGSGFTRIDDNEDSVFAERLPVNDLLFDRRECKYGKPQQAIRIQRVARDYLAELFPRYRDAIERAPSSLRRKDDSDVDGDGPRLGELDDYVDTWEAWHLPTMRESTNGRHALCIDTDDPKAGTLVCEEWKEPRFPWSHFQLGDPDWGIYPEGFVDQLAMLQHRVNCIVRDIQLNLAATGRGHFMVNEANDIPTEMLAGFQPFKLKFKGSTPPTWNAPTPFNPAQMGALEMFIRQMFNLSGVSESAATSKSSLGAGASGVALDTQYDIDSDRFRMPQANYARYRLNGAQCYLDAAARVARRRQSTKGKKRSWVAVSWKNRDAIQRLDYDKVALEDGCYRLRIEPVNFLPDTRAGKLSIVEQLAKAGVIPQWLVPTLFDEPDLQQANAIMLAAFQNCMRKMDDLADEDIALPMPEPYNDLELELKIVVAYYNRVQIDRAPEEIQDRYRQYADLVTDAIKTKNGGDMPAPPAMPPMSAAELPMPGGVPPMPQGPVPAPMTIGAPPMPPAMPMPMAS
jgi:hypothetical protein